VGDSIPELEQRHLDAGRDQAEAKRAYAAAVKAAEVAGVDPSTDIVVQRLHQNLETARETWRSAAEVHLRALGVSEPQLG
jgi:hypothetical protein